MLVKEIHNNSELATSCRIFPYCPPNTELIPSNKSGQGVHNVGHDVKKIEQL